MIGDEKRRRIDADDTPLSSWRKQQPNRPSFPFSLRGNSDEFK